jgi:hypothetical protein
MNCKEKTALFREKVGNEKTVPGTLGRGLVGCTACSVKILMT